MKKKGYLFIVVIIIGLNLAAFYYYYCIQKTSWEKEKKGIELKVVEAQEKYNEILLQLNEYETKLKEHETKNESLSQEIVSLQQRIALLQEEKQELAQKLEHLSSPAYLADIIRDRIRLKLEAKEIAEDIKTKDKAIISLVKARENLEALLGKEKHLAQELAHSLAEEKKRSRSLTWESAQKVSLFGKMEAKIDTLENSQLFLRNKIKGLEKIVWEKTKEIKALERKFDSAYGKTEILEKKLSQAKEEKELLEEELAATRRGYEEIKASKNDLENKLKGIVKENRALSAKLLETDQKTAVLDEKLGKMELSISEKELEKKEIEEKYERLEQKEKDTSFMLELTKTITLPEDREEPLADIKAKILATSDKYNFIIIDIGEDDRVKIGDTFSVYRADRKIGEVEVIRIRSTSSFAKITSEELPITTADIIR